MRINQIPKEQMVKEGAFIKSQMEAMGVSQGDVAAHLGVEQAIISKWWSGTKPINEKRLFALGGILNFNPFKLRPSLLDRNTAGFMEGGLSQALSQKIVEFQALAEPEDEKKLAVLLDVFLADLSHRRDKQ
jgi:transcriptional regulator with XRE-family HTH domain